MKSKTHNFYFSLLLLALVCFLSFSFGEGLEAADLGSGDKQRNDKPEELFDINYSEFIEIKDLVDEIARWTHKNVIIDRNVTGKIKIIAPKKVTREEAYQTLISSLNLLGLSTIETGKFLKITPTRNAHKSNVGVVTDLGQMAASDQVVTYIHHVKYMDAKSLQLQFARIMPTNAIEVHQGTNTLIISGPGQNISKATEILKLIDVKLQQPQLSLVTIQHRSAKEVGGYIKDLYVNTPSGRKNARGSHHRTLILINPIANSVAIFAKKSKRNEILRTIKKLDRPTQLEPYSGVKVYHLKFANAQKLSNIIKGLVSHRPKKQLRSGEQDEPVKIIPEETTNSILLAGPKAEVEDLEHLIRRLDIQKQQAFIEVDILDVDSGDKFTFASSTILGLGSAKEDGNKVITAWEGGAATPVAISSTPSQSSSSEVLKAFESDLTIAALSTKGVEVPGIGKVSPTILLKTIKSDSKSRSIASPFLLTLENEEASISVGQDYFYRVNISNSNEVKKEQVDLSLSVTPSFTKDRQIVLDVKVNSKAITSFSSEGIPQTGHHKAQQIVTLKDGYSAVIAGLNRLASLESSKKIPLLGDIPILGVLFRNRIKTMNQRQYMIFLTPHIIEGPADLSRIYAEKLKDMGELNKFSKVQR